MPVEKWNPIGDLIAIQDRLNNLLKDALSLANMSNDRGQLTWSPQFDFFETDEAFFVVGEIPELKAENLSIDVENGTLVIAGTRPKMKNADQRRYYRKERPDGTFRRTFNLSAPVMAAQISAHLQEGVLEVCLPKSTKIGGKSLKVKIKHAS